MSRFEGKREKRESPPDVDGPESVGATEGGDRSYVSVRDLRKEFSGGALSRRPPVRAVDGVSFDVNRGETLGLVGESGCGKTTLGRTLVGLGQPTDGRIEVDGVDVTTVDGTAQADWGRTAQIVFQDPEESLNDRLTVGRIVREPLDAHDWRDDAARRERVFDLLDRVGLQEEHYYRYPHQFSGGQRQRVGIARALALEPEFLVLDEPVSALDASVQARVVNLLQDLQDDLGLTYVFIAHDLSVVRHIADRVAVMYLGNLVEVGPTDRVFEDPQHPYTASLLSAIPGSAGPDAPRITLRGTPPNPRHPPEGCPFAPRCPARVRPDLELTEEQWAAVERFRSLVREGAVGTTGLSTAIRRRLGLGGSGETLAAAAAKVFADVTLPADTRDHVDAAIEAAADGRESEALAALDPFTAACESEAVSLERVSEERAVACVRNDQDHEDTASVLYRREDRSD